MKNIFVFLLLNFFVLSSHLEGKYSFDETLVVNIPEDEVEQKWRRAHAQSTPDGMSVVEYIPNDQTFDNLLELITVQFFAHSACVHKFSSATEFTNNLYEQLKNKYPGMIWNILKQSQNDVISEWILSDYSPPQHEIARIIWTPKGIHRVAYEKRVPKMDAELRALWLERIETTKLVPSKEVQ